MLKATCSRVGCPGHGPGYPEAVASTMAEPFVLAWPLNMDRRYHLVCGECLVRAETYRAHIRRLHPQTR